MSPRQMPELISKAYFSNLGDTEEVKNNVVVIMIVVEEVVVEVKEDVAEPRLIKHILKSSHFESECFMTISIMFAFDGPVDPEHNKE